MNTKYTGIEHAAVAWLRDLLLWFCLPLEIGSGPNPALLQGKPEASSTV